MNETIDATRPAPGTEEEDRRRRLRAGLFIWLLVALLSFLLLFTCAQLAGLGLVPEQPDVEITSKMKADYGSWAYTPFSPISPAILLDIIDDLELLGTVAPRLSDECLIPGSCAPGGPTPTGTGTEFAQTAGAPTVTPTPSETPSPSSTPTITDTPTTVPTATNTPTPTPLVYPVKLANPSNLDPTQDQTVLFTIYVINYGSEPPAELTALCDFLPAGFSYVADSANRGGTPGVCPDGDPNAIVWTPSVSIPQGGFERFSFQATTNFPSAGSEHTNTVRTFGGNFDTATNWTLLRAYTPTPEAIAANDSYSTDEDVTLVEAAPGVLGNDTNGDSASLLATPANGSLTLAADGGFTYSPSTNYNGADSFQYEACASGGSCDSASVSISIAAVEDAPIVQDDNYSVDEDGFLSVSAANGVLDNDTDPDSGDSVLWAFKTSDPASGTVTSFAEDGSFNYQPPQNFFGAVNFSYEACDEDNGDPGQDCTGGTVTITVNEVNDPPEGQDDSDTTDEDTAVTIDVLANDSDPVEGDPLYVGSVTDGSNGTVTNNTSDVTYSPDPNFDGPEDTFTYTVCDTGSPSGACDSTPTTVTVTVRAVNDAPVAVDDAATISQFAGSTSINVLANDSDPVEGDALEVTSVTPTPTTANGGSVSFTPSDVSYEPDGVYHSPTVPDTFEYRMCDDGTTAGSPDPQCDTATVEVIVNDPPSADDDAAVTSEDTSVAIDVLANDSDPNDSSDPIWILASSVTDPANGTATVNDNGTPGDLTDDYIDYDPDENFNGSDSFTYQATDGGLNSTTATVTITVNPVNDAPVASNDTAVTDVNVDIDIGVLSNDNDVDVGDTLAVNSVTQPANGTTSINPDDTIHYSPDTDYFSSPAPDTFQYTVCDDGTTGDPPVSDPKCDTATVSVTVNGPPNAVGDPSATTDYQATEDTTLNVSAPGVLDNDTDPNGDSLSLSRITADVTDGTLIWGTDGSFSYTPDTNFTGNDSFTYEACDPRGLCDTATATITVNEVNDPPTAQDDSDTVDEDSSVAVDVLANDSDIEGDTIALTQITSGPSNGSAAIEDQGTGDPSDDVVRYTPSTNYNGGDSFNYEICDDGTPTECSTATVTMTVNPVEDDPTAVNDERLTGEDEAIPIDVLSNDFDVDGDPISVVTGSVTDPANGTAALNPDDTITYTPDPGFHDVTTPDTFQYTIEDSTGRTDSAQVSVTVNDAPIADDDGYSVAEDTLLSVPAPGVLAGDSDPNGDTLTIVDVTGPSNASTFSLNGDGSFTYQGTANFNGTDNFTYRVTDGGLDSNLATVTITVTAVNDAPDAVNDSATTDVNVAIDINVLANDDDPVEGDILSIDSFDATSADGGTVTLDDGGNGDPSDDVLNYDPPADTSTTPGNPDTFDYTICDDGTTAGSPDPKCDSATVSVTINGPPTAVDDPSPSTDYTVDEDNSLSVAAPGLLDNDSDPNGDSLTVNQITGDVSDGTLTWSGDGSFTYTPDANFNGSDSFTYEVCDPRGLCDTATATIEVNAIEDPPSVTDDNYSVNEDNTLSVSAPGVLGNDSDPDGDSLSAFKTSDPDPSEGTITSFGSDGSFSFEPAADFFGTVQFTYDACDEGTPGPDQDCTGGTVTITVEPVNDPPTANDDADDTQEDTSVTIDVLVNDDDPDGDTLTVSDVGEPNNGSAAITDGGSTVTYSPDPNWFGEDSFSYTVSDGNGGSDTANVSVTVTSVNDAPVAADDSSSTGEGVAITIDVLSNDTDVEGDSLTVTNAGDPANGSTTVNGDGTIGTITYDPDPGFSHPTDPDTFTYEICDDGTTAGSPDPKCDNASVSVIVNDRPTAVDDPSPSTDYSVDEDNSLSVVAPGLLDNDSDPNGDSLQARKLSDPSDGSLTFNSNGSFTYEPDANFHGSDSFTYEACDDLSGGLCDSATVTITVNSVNDAPIASDDDAGTIDQGTSITVTVLANDNDIDGSLVPTTVQVVSTPSAGVAAANSDGTITYTHDGGAATSDSFTYNVEDDEGAVSNEATVTVAIRRPDLFVDLSPADASAGPSETVSFTAAFGNDGPGTAYEVEVTASATSGCTLLTSNPIFSGNLMESGGGFETVEVRAPSSESSSCDVSVSITSTNGIGDGDTSTISTGSSEGSSSTSSEEEPSPTPTDTPTPTATPEGSTYQPWGLVASSFPDEPGARRALWDPGTWLRWLLSRMEQ